MQLIEIAITGLIDGIPGEVGFYVEAAEKVLLRFAL